MFFFGVNITILFFFYAQTFCWLLGGYLVTSGQGVNDTIPADPHPRPGPGDEWGPLTMSIKTQRQTSIANWKITDVNGWEWRNQLEFTIFSRYVQ